MAQKFTVPVTIKNLSSAGSDGITVYIDQETYSRLKIEAGGRITWGDGTGAGDTNLYRDSANTLKTDDDFKVGGKLSVVAASGEEGGEIFLAQPLTNNSLNGGVTIDVYQNKIRFFEQGGSARGAYIDLTAAAGGAGTNILASGGASTLDELTDVSAPSPSDGQFLKYVSASSAWVPAEIPTINALDDIGNVTVPSPSSGDFLKWNGTAWVNDPINLGTDTTGNYVSDISGGTGVTVSHTPGEGSSASISIGQDVSTSASVTFAHVSADVTGDITGNADTATALQTARVISLTGDVSGSASFDGTQNINIAATVNSGSVAIGELSGVNITSPEEYQVISYNGTEWVNEYPRTVSYVRNVEATTLTTGTAVYLFGGTGDHASVKRADNSSDTTSSKTVGLVANAIASNDNGAVVTRGYVDGVNLTAFNNGDVLWLGKNGQLTTTKPSAPDHLVFIGVVVRNNSNGIVYVATQNGYELEELHDVSIDGVADGQYLRYNSGSAIWVNDTINLGTDTVGDYVQSLVAGTGVTLSNNSGEGSTPTVAIGQAVGTSASVVFGRVETTGNLVVGGNISVSGSVITENQASLVLDDPFIYLNGSSSVANPDLGIAGNYNDGTYAHTGLFRDATDGKWKFFDGYTPEPTNPIDVGHASYSAAPVVAETFESTISTGTAPFTVSSTTEVANLHADTATSLHTARNISLSGDVSGSASFDGSSDVTITATVQPNSVALGTDTTGNYMSGVAEGTGVTIVHTPGEGSSATISIGQAVGTSSSVQFAAVTAPLVGNVTGNASTASSLQTARTISLSGDVSGSVSFDGSSNASITATIQPDSVALGTDTTGNYVQSLVAGTGITLTNATASEGGTPTIAVTANTYQPSLVVSDTLPSSPVSGMFWYESDTGKTFVYYDSFWVEIGGQGGPTGPAGSGSGDSLSPFLLMGA